MSDTSARHEPWGVECRAWSDDLQDGDIVISRAGSVGYSHLVKNPRPAVFASYLIRFMPLIDEHYFAYFPSPSYWDPISEKSLGTAIPNVNASKLKQIALPLAPFPEQHRIVAEIEKQFTRLDAGVAALKRAQANLNCLLHECDVHTLLRLPTGIFYAQGVKANVLFFDRKPASDKPWTTKLWIYDLRTNQDFSLKQNPLTREHLDEFVACFRPDAGSRHLRKPTWSEENPPGRWRVYTYDELMARDKVNLDIFWLQDESLEDTASLADPDVLAGEMVEDFQAALEQFGEIAEDLTNPLSGTS